MSNAVGPDAAGAGVTHRVRAIAVTRVFRQVTRLRLGCSCDRCLFATRGKGSLTALFIILSLYSRAAISNNAVLATVQVRASNGMTEQLDDFGILLNRLGQPSRLVLFYARQVFSSYPGSMIEPAHIALGTLRHDATLLLPYLKSDWTTARIEAALIRQLTSSGTGPLIPEHIEVTFSPAVRALILNSASIADSLGSKTIEPGHILVALLRDETSPVSQLLLDAGVNAEAIVAVLRK